MRSANIFRSRLATGLSGLTMTLMAGFSATSMAGTVDLSTKPPEASTTVAPNLVLTFDDSGSMNWHHAPDQRPYTGSGWSTGNDSSQTDSANKSFPSGASPYLCAGVITPGVMDRSDPRSWSMNGVYFNPDNTYAPPLKADGITTMLDSPYKKAWDNGIVQNRPAAGTSTTTDLSGVSFCKSNNLGWKAGPGYYRYKGAALTLSADGQMDTASKNRLYTPSNWEWVSITDSAGLQNFANWYSYYRTRTMAAVTAISRAYAPFDKNVRVAWQNINSNYISSDTKIYKFVDDATTDNVRSRFYNWLFAMPATGGTPNRTAVQRVGKYFTNRTGALDNNPYWDRDAGKELVCRQNFHIQMTDGM